MKSQATNSAEYLSPASAYESKLAEHELVDMGNVTRQLGFRTKKAIAGRKRRKSVPNGVCNHDGCEGKAKGWSKRPQLRCCACKDGKGAYYHLACFFATHRCHVGR